MPCSPPHVHVREESVIANDQQRRDAAPGNPGSLAPVNLSETMSRLQKARRPTVVIRLSENQGGSRRLNFSRPCGRPVVEPNGIEPMTSGLQSQRSPN